MDELRGLYFDASTHPRGEQAVVRVEGASLEVVRVDGKIVTLPLESCDIRWGGAEGDTLVFCDGAQPPAMVFVEDRRVLDSMEQSGLEVVAARARSLRRQGQQAALTWKLILGGGLAVLMLLIGGTLAGFPFLVDFAVALVPPSWEESAGSVLVQQLIAGKTEVKDPAVLQQVRLITGRLVDAAGKVPYEFNFHVVDDPMVNAFAVPGGEVVLLTGLLKKAQSADEVAGVLGHEIQHVLKRHSLRRMARQLGVVVVFGLLFGDASVLAQASSSLLDSKFSRSEESESDREGAKLLLAAGIPVDGMAAFFDRMAKDAGKLENALEFVSSHPASEGRAAAIRKLGEEARATGAAPKPIAIDWKAFQASLENVSPEASRTPAK